MMRLSDVAKACSGSLFGDDRRIASVGTDSRAVEPSQLFVALKGEKFNGHQFVAQALREGAVGALVSDTVGIGDALPYVSVSDTRVALGQLSAYWRSQFTIPLLGVTGSSGKTTVKEMLASILSEATGNAEVVLATQGNLNNDIGMPLTLLRLREAHRYAVIEMGMNHAGEIRYLTKLARPSITVINNAGSAHIGELGSLEAIANAKGEILEGLAADGTAVLNVDDVFYPLWRELATGKKIMTFGLKQHADVTADYVLTADAIELTLKTPNGVGEAKLVSPGLHNVMNALAASATAIAAGVNIEAICAGLANYRSIKGRLQVKQGLQNNTVIDDTYNANPISMKAAIDVLAGYPGVRCFVMGDMGELGDTAINSHQEVGAYAKSKGIEHMMAVGEHSRHAVMAFGHGKHYESKQALCEALIPIMQANMTVLVKGSRFMGMEDVVKKLIKQQKGEHHVA